nr:SANT DNA binding [Hymenolepis microstoma]
MANAQKVANIFELASAAFKKMADLTIDLKIFQTQSEQGPSTSSRWTIIEIEALKEAVARFGNDLNKIASMIETKTVTQIKHKLKTQALEGPTSDRAEGEENDIKDIDEFGESEIHITELPPVSTVSVDRGRRKQTFSERNDFETPEVKKSRLDATSSMPVVRQNTPIAVRPSAPIVQRLPVGVAPTSSVSVKPRVATPSASAILSHAHMRKQAIPPADSKYEDYSDFDGEDPYEDVHNEDDDDDEDEISDEPYYSEEEEVEEESPDGGEGN